MKIQMNNRSHHNKKDALDGDVVDSLAPRLESRLASHSDRPTHPQLRRVEGEGIERSHRSWIWARNGGGRWIHPRQAALMPRGGYITAQRTRNDGGVAIEEDILPRRGRPWRWRRTRRRRCAGRRAPPWAPRRRRRRSSSGRRRRRRIRAPLPAPPARSRWEWNRVGQGKGLIWCGALVYILLVTTVEQRD